MPENVERGDITTPFLAQKTARQFVEFAIDPSKGLTRKRYAWHSNNSLFDDTHFSSSNVPGAIEISTSSTSTDTARIRSAVPGRYQSHDEAVPGEEIRIPSSNLSFDSDGYVSLNNGLIAAGNGWHEDGSGGWSVGSSNVKTFLGFKYTTSGVEAVLVSNGSEIASVSQENWNIDSFNGSGVSNVKLDPSTGIVKNQPHVLYNGGPAFVGFIDDSMNRFLPAHKFEVEGEPVFDRFNTPTTVIVDNDGDSSSTTVETGGMQYSRYGSGIESISVRNTPSSRVTTGSYIADQVSKNKNAIDPRATTGKPLISFRRKSGERDTTVNSVNLEFEPDNDIYIFIFDEFDDPTALSNQNFREPHVAASGKETNIEVDTEADGYSPEMTSFRTWEKFKGGNKNKVQIQLETLSDRLPVGATRILTAVHDGTSADVDPSRIIVREGF